MQQQRQNEQITLLEVWVDDLEDGDDETWWVTPTVQLQVPKRADSDLVAAIVDSICQC